MGKNKKDRSNESGKQTDKAKKHARWREQAQPVALLASYGD